MSERCPKRAGKRTLCYLLCDRTAVLAPDTSPCVSVDPVVSGSAMIDVYLAPSGPPGRFSQSLWLFCSTARKVCRHQQTPRETSTALVWVRNALLQRKSLLSYTDCELTNIEFPVQHMDPIRPPLSSARYKRRIIDRRGTPAPMSAAESNCTAPRNARISGALGRRRLLQPLMHQVSSAHLPNETPVWHIPMALFRLLAVAVLWVAAAVSAPIYYPQKPLVLGSSGTCESIDRFTTQWFLENTKPEYRQEIIDKALFYTAGASEDARRLACRSNEKYLTIWQIC
jgi:hypothetical protein